MAKVMLRQCADDLTTLMQSVVKRIEAANRGEPIPQFSNDELTGLLCCVGDALITNHRANKLSETANI